MRIIKKMIYYDGKEDGWKSDLNEEFWIPGEKVFSFLEEFSAHENRIKEIEWKDEDEFWLWYYENR